MVQYQSFDLSDPDCHQLQALDSGLIVSDTIDCDDTKHIVKSIQNSLDLRSLREATTKRSTEAITLRSLKPSIIIGNEQKALDSMILFSWLVVYFLFLLRLLFSSVFSSLLSPRPY